MRSLPAWSRHSGPRPDPGAPRSRRVVVSGAVAAAVLTPVLGWWRPWRDEPSPSGRMAFATGVTSGVYARYGELLRQALARDLPRVEVTLTTSEGSVDNLDRVTGGRADFVVATADAVDDYRIEHPGDAAALRACARLYDDYLQLVVPRSSPIRSARDLGGRRVGVGADGSGVQLATRRLLTAAGLDMSTDVRAVRVGIDRMPALLESTELDAFFWSGGLPTSAVQRLTERLPVRLVQLADLVTPLRAAGRRSRHYRAAVMPADAYPGAQDNSAVRTVAVANLLVTTDRMAADLTEAVTRAVIHSRDRIGNVVHAAQKVDLRTAVFTDPLPLHEGAERYYRSVKP